LARLGCAMSRALELRTRYSTSTTPRSTSAPWPRGRTWGCSRTRVYPPTWRCGRGSGRRLVMGSICLLSDGGLPSVSCVTHYSFVRSFVHVARSLGAHAANLRSRAARSAIARSPRPIDASLPCARRLPCCRRSELRSGASHRGAAPATQAALTQTGCTSRVRHCRGGAARREAATCRPAAATLLAPVQALLRAV
jgi:hypothetical protein